MNENPKPQQSNETPHKTKQNRKQLFKQQEIVLYYLFKKNYTNKREKESRTIII